ncbi:MAG TPA: oligosaccharide flippase family protein [Pyrinomonadaceae bacterium]|nr:oligosaccharide flippase family protein [Pyrinomonadaceae bacterium]
MIQHAQRSSLTVQAFWLLVAKTFAFVFAFALPILLTRSLSQNEYGLFKQVFLIITTATSLLPLGFGMSAYYYLPRENDGGRRAQVILNILLFNLILGLAACLIFVFRPGLVAAIFNDPSIPSYAPLVGVVILLWLFSSFLETAAVANQELTLATIFIIGGQLTRTALLLAAAVLFNTVQALVYAALIHGVLQSGALVWYASSRFPRLWQEFDWSLTRKQIAYALPFGLAGLLYTIQTDLHNYFVSNRFSTATFAIYSIGVAQLPFIGIVRESVSSVILPRISYLQEQGMEREILVLIANATRKLAAAILPVFAFLMVMGREFLTVMFTSAYAGSWPIFAINLLLLPLSLIEVDAVARAYQRYRFFLLKLQIALSVFMVFALWYAISRFGLIGAVSVVVIINLLLRVVLAAKFIRVLGVKVRDLLLFKDVGKLMLASTLAGVAALSVRSLSVSGDTRHLVLLLISASVFGVIYLTSVVLLRVPTDDERCQARRGVERLQQFVFPQRSADSVS